MQVTFNHFQSAIASPLSVALIPWPVFMTVFSALYKGHLDQNPATQGVDFAVLVKTIHGSCINLKVSFFSFILPLLTK
jgi:hypothetical protein